MDPDLTVVLLGNTGVGKSASGNTLLGSNEFVSRRAFKSITTEITEKIKNVCGKHISVVDTPGILTAGSERIVTFCETLLQSSRICLFLVVVKIDRFTDEQKNAVEAAIKAIGNQGLKNSYMLFTAGDFLDSTIEAFIEDSEGLLPPLIERFEGRYHVFNNTKASQEQVRELLQKWDTYQTSIQHACSQGNNPGPSLRRRAQFTDTSGTSVREPRRIVLFGLPGAGKSSSGNTILGSNNFETGPNFEPVTMATLAQSRMVEGRQITVVDTPGLDKRPENSSSSNDELFDQIMATIEMSNPGPHAFVFVVKIGRISPADAVLLDLLSMFGTHSSKYSMVLFTHGDELGNRSIEDLIRTNNTVSKLVSECEGRYSVFCNRSSNRDQVRNFLSEVDKIVDANRGQHFTSDSFRQLGPLIRARSIGDRSSAAEEKRLWWQTLRDFFRNILERICECLRSLKRNNQVYRYSAMSP